MPCYHPLTAFKSLTEKTANGKSLVEFSSKGRRLSVSPNSEQMALPCGQCLGCRMDRSKQWALRCWHEASLFDSNTFITLTFNDENLNPNGSLVRADFQKFMKRLRKDNKGLQYVQPLTGSSNPYPIRFFHCGEYGENLTRPHHHACLFNFDFQDKYLWDNRKPETPLFRSASLEKLWPYGFSTIGEVTFKSAAYVARYITKKVNGQHAASHYLRGDPDEVDPETGETSAYYLEPEYITMSLRPGVGGRWFEKNPGDVYPKDFTTVGGRKFKTPAYYDRLYERSEPDEMAQVKQKRKLACIKNASDNTPARLKAKAAVAFANNKRLVREYENQ